MAKINTTKNLYMEDVRNLCIEHQWCTNCDTEQYSFLLESCKDSDCEPESLYNIAMLILAFSKDLCSRYGAESKDVVSAIMYELNRTVQTTFEIE